MDEQRSYCGQPVTKCALIIAWIGVIMCCLSLIGTAYTKPVISVSVFLTFLFYILTIIGLRKENPTYILISSIVMLIHAVIDGIAVILCIVAAIVLPETIVQVFRQGTTTEEQARTYARIACIIYAFGSFLAACFATFAFNVFSNARKYYLQRGSYISPSILESH